MPINTIITRIIGILCANLTLISALRALHDSDLKKIQSNLESTVNEFRALVKTTECPGGKAAKKAENEIPGFYKSWERSISWPTWAFALYVTVFTIVFVLIKWPTSSDGQASSNELTDFITQHCWCVKAFVCVFLLFNIGCFFSAVYAQRMIRSLNSEVEKSTQDVKAALLK